MSRLPDRLTAATPPDAQGARLRLLDRPPAATEPVLGLVWFGDPPAEPLPATLPWLQVPLTRLGDEGHGAEAWLGDVSASGDYQGIRYRADGTLLFGVLVLEERLFAEPTASGLQGASEAAYTRIFNLLRDSGYPHLVRTWNYIARINDTEPTGQAALERYRQFNIGRQAAFDRHRHRLETSAPAACALGTADGPLHLAFIAGRDAPQLIENPRQVSAYRYPAEYGPRSPTFSRAAWVRSGNRVNLLISGTASIVGHRSMHPGDVAAQTREALNNIEVLVDRAQGYPDAPDTIALADLHYRVYLRQPEALPEVRHEIGRRIGGHVACTYLQADVCRRELLVEIEATGDWPAPAPAGPAR